MFTDDLCFQVSNLISPYHPAFRNKCSYTTNLLHLSTVVNRGFSIGNSVIYTDFSKAFDKINHVVLKKILYLMGFTNLSLKWDLLIFN